MINQEVINDNINYIGNVTLKYEIDNHIIKTINIKNKGTNRLFKCIALALLGHDKLELQTYLPQYVSVGNSNTILDETSTRLPNEVLSVRANIITTNAKDLKDKTTDKVIGSIAPFRAVIPSKTIKGNVKQVGIFSSKTGDTLLAWINLDNEIQIPAGMNLIVEWDMNIKNGGNI